MSNRLTQIATRTGDDGSTGLGDGSRTRKDALRVAAMGDVDELNSGLGVLLAETRGNASAHASRGGANDAKATPAATFVVTADVAR